jgi:hypothetical protein
VYFGGPTDRLVVDSAHRQVDSPCVRFNITSACINSSNMAALQLHFADDFAELSPERLSQHWLVPGDLALVGYGSRGQFHCTFRLSPVGLYKVQSTRMGRSPHQGPRLAALKGGHNRFLTLSLGCTYAAPSATLPLTLRQRPNGADAPTVAKVFDRILEANVRCTGPVKILATGEPCTKEGIPCLAESISACADLAAADSDCSAIINFYGVAVDSRVNGVATKGLAWTGRESIAYGTFDLCDDTKPFSGNFSSCSVAT